MIRARGSGDPLDQGRKPAVCTCFLTPLRCCSPRGSDLEVCINAAVPRPLPTTVRPSPAPPCPPRVGNRCRHGAGTLYWCGSQHHTCTSQASVGEDMFEPSVRRAHARAIRWRLMGRGGTRCCPVWRNGEDTAMTRDSMLSGMAQRRGHCDNTDSDGRVASLPPDGGRGVAEE